MQITAQTELISIIISITITSLIYIFIIIKDVKQGITPLLLARDMLLFLVLLLPIGLSITLFLLLVQTYLREVAIFTVFLIATYFIAIIYQKYLDKELPKK